MTKIIKKKSVMIYYVDNFEIKSDKKWIILITKLFETNIGKFEQIQSTTIKKKRAWHYK